MVPGQAEPRRSSECGPSGITEVLGGSCACADEVLKTGHLNSRRNPRRVWNTVDSYCKSLLGPNEIHILSIALSVAFDFHEHGMEVPVQPTWNLRKAVRVRVAERRELERGPEQRLGAWGLEQIGHTGGDAVDRLRRALSDDSHKAP